MGIYTTKERVIVEDIGKDFKMNNRSFLRILQEAATICYNLLEETEAVPLPYGIELVEKGKYNRQAERLERLFPSKEQTVQVLAFLYENAVTAIVWREVVEDLLEQISGYRQMV